MPKLENLNLSSMQNMDMSEIVAVIPFSSYEPVGETLPFSIYSKCTNAISDELAEGDEYLVLPQITSPYAVPFQGFRGVFSLRRKVFMNLIADTALSVSNWGVKRILFLDGTSYAKQSIDQAMKKFKRQFPDDFSYGIVNWQNSEPVKRCSTACTEVINEPFRSELGAMLLYCEITGDELIADVPENTNISAKQFEQWKRRGKDPERLVKYFPKAHLSHWSGAVAPDEKLLPQIRKSIVETVAKGYLFHGI